MSKGMKIVSAVHTRAVAICIALAAGDAALGAEGGRPTVQVRNAAGTLVPRAYIAFVPVWRPWSKPSVEEIAARGTATVEVSSGTYSVLAAARGYAFGVQESVRIQSGSRPLLTITLAPYEELSGRVTAEDGRPLAGARVSTAHGAIPPRLGKMSELAVRHLGEEWVTTTDRDGRFRLKVAKGEIPVLFEARGYAGQWRVRAAGATELDARLSRGGSLRIVTDRIEPDVVVAIARESTANEQAVLADEQSLVWARWADGRTLVWDSLPPGTYHVRAQYADPKYFHTNAEIIATAHVAAGQEQVADAVLPSARKPRAGIRELWLWRGEQQHLAAELAVFGTDASGARRRLPHLLQDVIEGTLVHVDAERAGPPFYATTADAFYATMHDLTADGAMAAPQPWLLLSHRRADVAFQVRFADEELQRPTTAVASLRGCRNVPVVKTTVEIEGTSGRFAAPAMCESLVIDVQPFEPVIVNRSLRPGEQALGEYVLRAAGAADIRVRREPGGAVVAGAKVRAVSAESGADNSVVIKESTTNEQGWAYLTGLPPYWAMRVVAQSDEGEAARGVDLRVRAKERAVIDPLPIPTPATLLVEARLDPSFSARFPNAAIVTLSVTPADEAVASGSRRQDVIGVEPPARFDKLHAGRWRVIAAVRVAGTYAPVELAEVDLASGEERRLQSTVAPKVYEGVVTSKGEGVAAKLMVDVRGTVVTLNTAANGAFSLPLQEEGVYPVAAARLSNQGNIVPLGNVRFGDPSRRIEIVLPEGAEVTAVARAGTRAIPNVSVWVSRRDDTGNVERLTKRARTTNVRGEATFSDVAPGIWTFSVDQPAEGLASEKTAIVEAGQRLVVELDLKRTTSILGVIRDVGGGTLPRARVDCVFVGPTGAADRVTAETDADGAFEIAVGSPAPPEAFCSAVSSIGAADVFRATPGQRADLTMPAATGRVQLADWANDRGGQDTWLVTPDGRAISLAAVAAKVPRRDSSLEIALRPGAWKLVRVTSTAERLAMARGGSAALPAIADVALRAGATEKIHLRPSQGGAPQ